MTSNRDLDFYLDLDLDLHGDVAGLQRHGQLVDVVANRAPWRRRRRALQSRRARAVSKSR